VGVLRGTSFNGRKKSAFRRNLVVLQFIISITLIIGMIVVYNQMNYIQTRSIGFEKDNVVIISAHSNEVAKGYDAFRNEILVNSNMKMFHLLQTCRVMISSVTEMFTAGRIMITMHL
jgi:hypothetical protein